MRAKLYIGEINSNGIVVVLLQAGLGYRRGGNTGAAVCHCRIPARRVGYGVVSAGSAAVRYRGEKPVCRITITGIAGAIGTCAAGIGCSGVCFCFYTITVPVTGQ